MRLILFAACLMLAESAFGQCPGGVCPATSFGYQQWQPQYMQPSYQPFYRQPSYGGYGYYRQQFQPVRTASYLQQHDHWGDGWEPAPTGMVPYVAPQPGGDPYWYNR